MTSIGVIKMIDNHLYIPTARLHKEKRKRKGSEYQVYTPLNKGKIKASNLHYSKFQHTVSCNFLMCDSQLKKNHEHILLCQSLIIQYKVTSIFL